MSANLCIVKFVTFFVSYAIVNSEKTAGGREEALDSITPNEICECALSALICNRLFFIFPFPHAKSWKLILFLSFLSYFHSSFYPFTFTLEIFIHPSPLMKIYTAHKDRKR